MILAMSMPMASPSFAAVKDYATLQWDITLDSTEYPYVEGKEKPFTTYNIGGNNYFKLRDVAKVLNIGVGYDTATKVITIDTKVDYTN